MKSCYCCGTNLNKDNFSVEHIIPNSIGGKLKSANLLCVACNNILGSEIDNELAKQLNFFMNFFMLEREKGKFQPIKGKTKEGEEYILNGTEIKSKPKISVGQDSVSFSGNDENDLKVYFKGLLKKYPQLKMEDIIANANKGRYFLNEPVSVDLNVGGEKVFRAITKIAVNFYIYNGGDRKYITNILDNIKGIDKSKRTWYHFGFADENLKVDKNRLYHFIKLIGSSEEKAIYCYIELFGTLKFIIYLNDNYEGNDFDYQYFFNLFSKETINDQINISYKKNEILEILNNTDNQYFISNIQKNIQSTLDVAHKKQFDNIVSNLINESIEKVFSKSDESVITESMLKEFVDDISYTMAVYIGRDKGKGKTHF